MKCICSAKDICGQKDCEHAKVHQYNDTRKGCGNMRCTKIAEHSAISIPEAEKLASEGKTINNAATCVEVK